VPHSLWYNLGDPRSIRACQIYRFQLLYHVATRDAGEIRPGDAAASAARIDALYVMKRFDLTYSSRDNGLGPGEFDTTFFAWTMTQRRRADRDEVQLTKADHCRTGLNPKVKSRTSRS
jgi:hypothetical protein